MSFHKQEFHETKRERKFYEDKKQKAMTYLYQIIKRHDPELHSGEKYQQKVEVSYGRLIQLYNMIREI